LFTLDLLIRRRRPVRRFGPVWVLPLGGRGIVVRLFGNHRSHGQGLLVPSGAMPGRKHRAAGCPSSRIALGHPIGATGARLMTTLLNGLDRNGGRYGLQTMCEGGGQANVTIIERLA